MSKSKKSFGDRLLINLCRFICPLISLIMLGSIIYAVTGTNKVGVIQESLGNDRYTVLVEGKYYDIGRLCNRTSVCLQLRVGDTMTVNLNGNNYAGSEKFSTILVSSLIFAASTTASYKVWVPSKLKKRRKVKK